MLYPLLSAEYIKKINSHNLKVLILAEQTSQFSQFQQLEKIYLQHLSRSYL